MPKETDPCTKAHDPIMWSSRRFTMAIDPARGAPLRESSMSRAIRQHLHVMPSDWPATIVSFR
jgi:hypothetical protein